MGRVVVAVSTFKALKGAVGAAKAVTLPYAVVGAAYPKVASDILFGSDPMHVLKPWGIGQVDWD